MKEEVVYQPAKIYPLLVGMVGYVSPTVSVTVCKAVLPLAPLRLKLTVYEA